MKYKAFTFFLVIHFCIIIPCLHAQDKESPHGTEQTEKSTVNELQNDLEALIANPDLASATIGISIRSLETGEYFFKYNENKNFIPASTQKLLTTAAALEYLGADFRFSTPFYLDGTIESNGIFQGNIIIRGSGDPSWNTYFLKDPYIIIDNFIEKLDSLGINSIRGNIIGDDRYFDNIYYARGWAWDDMIYPFSAQINAISINGNKIDLVVEQGDSIGSPAKLSMYPDNSYVRLINNITTVKQSDLTEISYFRAARSNIIELFGVIEYDSTGRSREIIPVTIDNPTLFLLNIIKEKLDSHNILYRGAMVDADDYYEDINYYKMKPVFEYESPPLSEIIEMINKNSDNLGAELLLKTIAKEMTGTGSFRNGIELVKKFVSKKGIPPEKISMVDGSGLSRMNLLSPKYLVSILSAMYHSKYRDIYANSLAVPGQAGTLETRMRRTLAEDNLQAKTGSMNSVNNLCGYIRTRDGEILAFAIMIMNFDVPPSIATNLEDIICMRLASFSRK